MTLTHCSRWLIRKLFGGNSKAADKGRRLARSARRRVVRPRAEALEDRTLPAVPAYGFALDLGGPSYPDTGYATTTDALGNVYVTGSFQGTVNFNPGGTATNLTSSSSGGPNAFVAKYSPSGALVWAADLGAGASYVYGGYSIAVDSSGNVYSTGHFIGTGNFDPSGTHDLTSSSSNGWENAYVSKLNSGGSYVWAVDLGAGAGLSHGDAIAVDGSGNVYVGGVFLGTGNFDPHGTHDLASSPSSNIDSFVCKLDSSGSYVWAVAFGAGPASSSLTGIAVDGSGNVYTTGNFQGTGNFDPSGTHDLTSSPSNIQNAYVSKLNSSGGYVWAVDLGAGSTALAGDGIVVDGSGNVYTTGFFSGTGNFDPSGTHDLASSPASSDNAYVSKLNSVGSYVWAADLGAGAGSLGLGIALDGSANVYTTGQFTGTGNFDPSGTHDLTSSASSTNNVYVSKLSSSGSFVWANALGVGASSAGYGIAVDGSGNVYTTGQFTGTGNFDPSGTHNLTSMGGSQDAFLSQLTQGTPVVVTPSTANLPANAASMTINGSGFDSNQANDSVTFDDGVTGSVTVASATSLTVSLTGLNALVGGTALHAIVVADGNSSGTAVQVATVAPVVTASNANLPSTATTLVIAGFGFDSTAAHDSVTFDNGVTGSVTSAGTTSLTVSLAGLGSVAAGTALHASVTVNGVSSGSPVQVATVAAPVPGYGFVLDLGSFYANAGNATATDSFGNVYVTGEFQGTVNFNPSGTATNLTSSGGENAFVAKYAASGTLIWAADLGAGAGGAVGTDVAVDGSGDVYTVGYFDGTGDFDPSGTHDLSSSGGNNVYVSKLSSSGGYIWAADLGAGATDAVGLGIALDGSGNVYTTGYFYGTGNFDPSGTHDLTSSPTGNYNAYVSKLSSSGSYIWAAALGAGASSAAGYGIAVDSSGNVYTTGQFEGTGNFDSSGTHDLTSSPPGSFNAYVSKLNSSGSYVWAADLGAGGITEGNGIAVDSSGNVCTTGEFKSTGNFDPSGTHDLTSSPTGNFNAYVSKLSSSGSYLWAADLGAGASTAGNSIALDGSGNVYTTGLFAGTGNFDPSGTHDITSGSGNENTYVSKLTSSGVYAWDADLGAGATFAYGLGITVDGAGHIYTTGQFAGTGNFNPTGTQYLTGSGGAGDAFLSQLTQPVAATSVEAASQSALFSSASQPVTLNATVSSSPTPVNEGTVTFSVFSGSTQIGSPVTSGTVSNGAASAIFTLPGGTPVGAYAIHVSYSGGGDFGSSNNFSDSTFPVLTVGPAEVIIDNGQAGYSETGSGWSSFNDPNAYNGNERYAAAGSGANTATWQATGLAAGTYNVEVDWTAYANRATNATYQVFDGATLIGTITVDQTQSPAGGVSRGGVTFQDFGRFTVASGTLKVVLSDNANGYVIADAVVVQVATLPAVVDNSQFGYSETGGGWTSFSDPNAYLGNERYAAPGVGNNTATWQTTGLAAGVYDVQVDWTPYINRADNATYKVFDGATLLATVQVDQQLAPQAGATVGGVTFQSLGRFSIGSGTLNVVLSDNADGYVIADAMLVELATLPAVVDNSQGGYSDAGGGWASFMDGNAYFGNERYVAPGTGTNTATWQAPGLAPGVYDVQVDWTAFANRATNATYQIYDGATLLGSATIDQTKTAVGGATINGITFQSLGRFTINSGSVKVVLSDNANGYVIADAMLAEVATLPAVIDNSQGGYSDAGGGWASFNDANAYLGNERYVAPGTGSNTATWQTSGLANGPYNVYVDWTPFAGRATNATYQIFDGTTLLATTSIDQTHAPSGDVVLNGVPFQSLGRFPITSGTVKVVLSDNANGYVIADAMYVKVATGQVVVDNGQYGYAETGTGWTSFNDPNAFNGNERYAAPGVGANTATWSVPDLAAGTYNVQVDWTAYANRATNATYQVFDGATLLGTVTVNQQVAPTGGSTVNGVTFQSLGHFAINSGTLRVVLTDNANGYVIADAMVAV
jgi:hypothetical protein